MKKLKSIFKSVKVWFKKAMINAKMQELDYQIMFKEITFKEYEQEMDTLRNELNSIN